MQNSDKLTLEQFKAVTEWAARHGRSWKRELSFAWMDGNYGCSPDIYCPLQQIRNTLGPEWLVKFSLKKAQAQYAAGLLAPHLRVIL